MKCGNGAEVRLMKCRVYSAMAAGKQLPETSLNVYTFLLQIVKKLVMKRLYVWGMHRRALWINSDDDPVKVGKRV